MENLKYGICIKPCNIQLTPVYLNNSGFLSAGSLFQILDRLNISEALIKRLTVEQVDKRRINFEKETYICDRNYIREIDYRTFLLVLATRQEKRLNIILNEDLMAFVKELRINQRVIIPKTAFHGRETDVDCVVRYIGNVPEIGLGIFFGFILVDPYDSIPVRGTLSQKYLRCENSKGFIRAVDVFNRNPQQQNKNNELKSFPSVSSIDPYGSMESLLSERGGKNKNHRQNRNENKRNNSRDGGMPIYKQNNFTSGMNLISFEPVNPNYMTSNNPPVPLMSLKFNKPTNNLGMSVTNTALSPPLQSAAPEHLLQKPEPLLSFAPVPYNVVENIIQKSHQNTNRENLRQKYEILKREFDLLKNAKANRLDTATLEKDQNFARASNTKVSQNKLKCSIKSCQINKPTHLSRLEQEYHWDGRTEFYTNSAHQVKCRECQHLKLKCYASKLYGGNREYNDFITVLNASGFNVPIPENKYLVVSDQDKTKLIDCDKKRGSYYECTIRSNITIHKNRFKSQCRKCKMAVDTSQGISLIACNHVFCNACIKSQIQSSSEAIAIKCPDVICAHTMVENEVHAFMTDAEFELYMQRVRLAAKFNPDDNIFYCKNKLCNRGISFNRENTDKFVLLYCPECGKFNCVNCNTIHAGLTCAEYQKEKSSKLPAVAIGATYNEIRIKNNFKCKVENCRVYLQAPNEAKNLIACPECGTMNCRVCEAIHVDMTCREYQLGKIGGCVSGLKLADFDDKDWVCKHCTYLNTEKLMRCQMCSAQRVVTLIPTTDYYQLDNASEDDLESLSSSTGENQYEKLLEFEDMHIIRNTSEFVCIICYDEIDKGNGIKLRECLHEFCEQCLTDVIKMSSNAPITCPFREKDFVCEGTIQHREMKCLVDEDVYEQYLYRSVLQAQKDLKNCFQCKTPDCRAMWEYDDNVFNYQCPSCSQLNCHQCNAIHGTKSCREYQDELYEDTNPEAIATRKLYDEWFESGKAVRCPQCKIAIVREEGCSWVVCSQCKTEICWATRGPRWGPKGNGDTSGGCHCDYKNGKPCHPDCGYCH